MMEDDDKIIQLVNCSLIKENEIIKEDLWMRSGTFINPEKLFYEEKKSSHVKLDCRDNLIAPGFIDLQINGGFGKDFSDVNIKIEESLNCVAIGVLKHGVTAFCPTLITQSKFNYHQILPRLKKRKGSHIHGASILGSHLEGPFISQKKKGAHPIEHIQEVKLKSIAQIESVYGDLNNTCIITLAPELDDGTVIRDLTNRGIKVSLGHSMANLEQGRKANSNGANFITHLFNAMLPFHHRDPGLIGLISQSTPAQPIYFGIIADGIHTHESALKIAYSSNPCGLVLVSDAISAYGLSPGKIHKIGHQLIEIKEGKAFLADSDILCGSIASMIDCIRNFNNTTNCGIVEAIKAATLHPAQVLGIEKFKGSLNYQSDADFVIMDRDLNILSTFINGKLAWKNETISDSHFLQVWKSN